MATGLKKNVRSVLDCAWTADWFCEMLLKNKKKALEHMGTRMNPPIDLTDAEKTQLDEFLKKPFRLGWSINGRKLRFGGKTFKGSEVIYIFSHAFDWSHVEFGKRRHGWLDDGKPPDPPPTYKG